MGKMKTDIEIARASNMKPIGDVLNNFNIPDDPFSFSPMGRHIAKLNFEYIDKLKEKVLKISNKDFIAPKENTFTSKRMTEETINLYYQLLNQQL